MPFYKRDNDELHCAPLFVSGPGLELTADKKDEYIYPVDGWRWFDSLDAAMRGLMNSPELGVVDAAMLALENHYDATARQRNYDNRVTCALRAGYPGPFQAEGLAFATWMDGCNAAAYAALPALLTSSDPDLAVRGFIEALPRLEWPAASTI